MAKLGLLVLGISYPIVVRGLIWLAVVLYRGLAFRKALAAAICGVALEYLGRGLFVGGAFGARL